jgi:SAM-dependent methyltransferase
VKREAASSERARAYFVSQAAGYHEKSAHGLWARLRSLETPAVMQLADVRPGERILDAGCGAGHYTKALLDAGADVDALDALPEMLDSVRSRLNVRTIQGDLATVALEPVYDKVVCAGVLEFVPDPARALANLARGLRVDGPGEIMVLVLARCLPGLGYWIARRCNGISMPMYTRAGIDRLAQSAGLVVSEAHRAGYNWTARLERAEKNGAGNIDAG